MSKTLPAGYRPSADEPFMNPRQREYFRLKLVDWRAELLRESEETRLNLEDAVRSGADSADMAADEADRTLELRTRDRERQLVAEIDAALTRINDGTYGYCADTGSPIGLKRLEARPVATLCIEAQERRERSER